MTHDRDSKPSGGNFILNLFIFYFVIKYIPGSSFLMTAHMLKACFNIFYKYLTYIDFDTCWQSFEALVMFLLQLSKDERCL